MKPWQILAFFLSVICTLIILSLVFPKQGIEISDGIQLKFFHLTDLWEKDSFRYADITDIIENTTVIEGEPFEGNEAGASSDDIMPEMGFDTIRANADSLKKIRQEIEFPEGNAKCLHPFFENLHRLQDVDTLIRVLHYGDSQIEKDRISGYIRNKLQQRFGGSGCGLVPAVPLYEGKMSVSQDWSDAWIRKTGFGRRDTNLVHRQFGALFTYAELQNSAVKKNKPWLEYKPSPISYPLARKFNRVSVFLTTENSSQLNLMLYLNDTLYEDVSPQYDGYSMLSWDLPYSPGSVRFELDQDSTLQVFGVSLDKQMGIALDNIPMRGSAGLEFSRVDTSLLKSMYKDLNIGLVILQFGGNVVPYMSSSSYFERLFKRELLILKSLLPGVPLLVIGPSDMSLKEDGRYISYPNLEAVRDGIREAALSSGCGFWDMYEAMGGQNSMPSWVFAKPALAVNDFVHFNHRGARIIAEMMYNSIMYEYDNWKRQYSK